MHIMTLIVYGRNVLKDPDPDLDLDLDRDLFLVSSWSRATLVPTQ